MKDLMSYFRSLFSERTIIKQHTLDTGIVTQLIKTTKNIQQIKVVHPEEVIPENEEKANVIFLPSLTRLNQQL